MALSKPTSSCLPGGGHRRGPRRARPTQASHANDWCRPAAREKKAVADAKLEAEQTLAEAARIREERRQRRAHERAAKLAAAEEARKKKLTVEALLRLWAEHKDPVWSDRSRDQIIQHMDDYVVPSSVTSSL